MSDRIKFGIVGLGAIARKFADALERSESAVLYGCAARSLEKAEAFKKDFGAEKAYGSYLELIQDPEVDAIYCSTIHPVHAEVIRMCIENHKPILSEKPMVVTLEDAKELIELAEKEKVLLMEAMWTRTLPCFKKVKEWVKDGRIGKVRLMVGNFIFRLDFSKSPELRHFDPTIAGGANWDAGVYAYDFFTGIMDEYPVYFDGVLQISEQGIDETSAYLLQFKDGTLAMGSGGFTTVADQTGYIYGKNGSIRLDEFWHSRKVELMDENGTVIETLEDPQENGFVYEVEHFCDLLRRGAIESDLMPHKDTIEFTEKALQCKRRDK